MITLTAESAANWRIRSASGVPQASSTERWNDEDLALHAEVRQQRVLGVISGEPSDKRVAFDRRPGERSRPKSRR